MSPPLALVSGLVRDEYDKPVPMARVSFVNGPVPLPDIAAFTDQFGAFTLSAKLPGKYELECVADGFQPSRLQVILSLGTTAHVTFRLKRLM